MSKSQNEKDEKTLTDFYAKKLGVGGWRDFEVQMTPLKDKKEVILRFSQMYEAVDKFSFDELEVLSRVFGTKNISFGSDFARPGCETCDYGSSYGFFLVVKDVTQFDLSELEKSEATQ